MPPPLARHRRHADDRRMPRRLANVVLFTLVVGLAASGLLGWLLPLGDASPLFLAHRVLGVALVLALGWKVTLARRSLARRLPQGDRSVGIGGVATALFVTSVVLGFAWTLGAVSF